MTCMVRSKKTIEKSGKVLVVTLTKKMAENLTNYFAENGLRVKYLHSDIDTLERVKILNELRNDDFDVLIGINLLREGLDLPEVELVAILDADKEGFLRSDTSLIQTIGRAARNVNGHVIMYADNITGSMRRAIDETDRRRKLQQQYNTTHGVSPRTVVRQVKDSLSVIKPTSSTDMSRDDILDSIEKLKGLMTQASARLDFERAIELREQITALRTKLKKK